MNLLAIYTANGFGIMLMAMLLLCAGRSLQRRTLSERIYYAMIWATIALCALEALSFAADGGSFPAARALCTLVNALLYALNIVFVVLWTVYVDYKLFGDPARIRRRIVWLALPAAAVFLMALANLFVPVFFTISDGNVYARTPLAILPYGVSFGYLAYVEVLILVNRRSARQYMLFPSVAFLLPILTGSILQMLFYGVSLTWCSLSISVVSIYITVQSEFSSVDGLSGLYTRQYLDDFLRQKAGGRGGYAGVMIDVDRFKDINDTYGHQAGDSAIRDTGRLLRACVGRGGFAARYGGDEFIILLPGGGEEDLRALRERIDAALADYDARGTQPYRLSFSYGHSFYRPERDTPDEFLRRMDDAMYEDKRSRSRVLPDRRRD